MKGIDNYTPADEQREMGGGERKRELMPAQDVERGTKGHAEGHPKKGEKGDDEAHNRDT
jgi:hypothetical protein